VRSFLSCFVWMKVRIKWKNKSYNFIKWHKSPCIKMNVYNLNVHTKSYGIYYNNKITTAGWLFLAEYIMPKPYSIVHMIETDKLSRYSEKILRNRWHFCKFLELNVHFKLSAQLWGDGFWRWVSLKYYFL
jgi:hypothetical protein